MTIQVTDVDYDAAGIRALLGSSEVADLMEAKASDVADRARAIAAGIALEGEPGDTAVPISHGVDSTPELHGYVGIDHPAGLAVEAKHRILGGALDAI